MDDFKNYAAGLSSPGEHAVNVTPSDADDLPAVTRALLVGVGGDVKVTMKGGEVAILPVVTGYNSLRVVRVWASELTAVNIVALW